MIASGSLVLRNVITSNKVKEWLYSVLGLRAGPRAQVLLERAHTSSGILLPLYKTTKNKYTV